MNTRRIAGYSLTVNGAQCHKAYDDLTYVRELAQSFAQRGDSVAVYVTYFDGTREYLPLVEPAPEPAQDAERVTLELSNSVAADCDYWTAARPSSVTITHDASGAFQYITMTRANAHALLNSLRGQSGKARAATAVQMILSPAPARFGYVAASRQSCDTHHADAEQPHAIRQIVSLVAESFTAPVASTYVSRIAPATALIQMQSEDGETCEALIHCYDRETHAPRDARILTCRRYVIWDNGPFTLDGRVNSWTDEDGSELCYLCAIRDSGDFGPLELLTADADESSACSECNQPLNVHYTYPGVPVSPARAEDHARALAHGGIL